MADNSSSSSSSASSSSTGEIESPFALLESIEAAIIKVADGMQSYKLGDRMVTYADLEELRKTRNELKAEVAQLQRTRPMVSHANMTGNF